MIINYYIKHNIKDLIINKKLEKIIFVQKAKRKKYRSIFNKGTYYYYIEKF